MIKKRVDLEIKKGIRLIIVKPVWDYPVTRGALIFHTGAYKDPEGKKGLSSIFFDLLNERRDIIDKMESLGARIKASSSLTKSFVSFAFLNAKLKKSFDLLIEFIKQFDVDEALLNIVKRKKNSSLALLNEDPEYLITRKLYEIIYPQSELSNPVVGIKEDIENIVFDDIKRFYKEEFLNAFLDIVVVSSEHWKRIKAFVEKITEFFSPSRIKMPTSPEAYIPQNIIIKKKHLGNVFVSYVVPACEEGTSEYLPLKLLSYILAEGSFNSRLVKRIREELGLAYYISSNTSRGFSVHDKKFRGYFEIIAETGKENRERLIHEIEHSIKEVFNFGITDEELQTAKSYYIGVERKRGETYKDILNTLMTERLYNLEKNYFMNIKDEINKVEKESIMASLDRMKEKHFSRIQLVEEDIE